MFIIVEGLVTKGWVEILAKGWAIWANKSNPAVAIAGMGFVSVCLCNVSNFSYFFCFLIPVPQFAGTNIGATILLSRVLQSWLSEHTPSEAYGTWDRALVSAVEGSPSDTLKCRSMPWHWVSIMAPSVSPSVLH
jgi:hypothetical protein